jgi:hypothetical protein
MQYLVDTPAGIRHHSHVTQFVQAMPAQYITPGDPVTGYRKFYNGEKHFATWKHREVPFWYLCGAQV